MMFLCRNLVTRRVRQLRQLPEGWSSFSQAVNRRHYEEEGCGSSRYHPLASHLQVRGMSISSLIPEFMQGYTIWGGAGFLLKTFHMDGVIPYWACFSIINILVRTMLFPLTLYSAHTAARFRPVAPEVQFLFQLYESNFKIARKEMTTHFRYVFREGWESIRGIYKLNNVNPFAPFLSPSLQIPFFVYISTDLRKIVNGRDPELAQALTDCGDSSLFWLRDLTEADPFYVLPIFAGLAMYSNVETALGRRSLAGEASSKANSAVLMKDIFQSVAVLMPCFSSAMPSGMQVYLCTTFVFTAAQSYALRNERFRQLVGLPSLLEAPMEPKFAKQLLGLKEAEKKADELRGDGPVLGKGVMVRGFRVSFPGTTRESTIEVDEEAPRAQTLESDLPLVDIPQLKIQPESFDAKAPFIPGITAPYEEMMERVKEDELAKRIQQHLEAQDLHKLHDKQLTEEQMIELMEKANLGERPVIDDSGKPNNTNNNNEQDAANLSMKRLKGKRARGRKRQSRRKR